MSAAQPAERPRAVTILGWVFLVAAVIYFLRSAINLLILEVLKAHASELLAQLSSRAEPWVPEWVLRHTDAIYAGQAAFAIAVALCAWGFLSLKPWARRSLQVLCWLMLALDACFVTFWTKIWAGRADVLPSTASRHGQFLYVGLLIMAAWAALIGIALWVLHSEGVRLAFGQRSDSGSG